MGDTGRARQGHQNLMRNERARMARQTLVAETRTQHTHTHTHHSNNLPTQAVIPVLNCHGSPDILSTILTLLKAEHPSFLPTANLTAWLQLEKPSHGTEVLSVMWGLATGCWSFCSPCVLRNAPRVNMCWTKHNSARPRQSSTPNAAPPRMRGNYTVHMTCRLFLGSVRETPRVQLRLP